MRYQTAAAPTQLKVGDSQAQIFLCSDPPELLKLPQLANVFLPVSTRARFALKKARRHDCVSHTRPNSQFPRNIDEMISYLFALYLNPSSPAPPASRPPLSFCPFLVCRELLAVWNALGSAC
uniref:(northern house mosquito) hypothetical protein n=1 Tax=Culex pipiens TaxID=7175 RepID=A0A8D8A5R9_CULPI